MIAATARPDFAGLFFSLGLNQQFNRRSHEAGFTSDEFESGIRKYARVVTRLYGE